MKVIELWFDVGIKRYTTTLKKEPYIIMLWFDVGIKRYTTLQQKKQQVQCCGLM